MNPILYFLILHSTRQCFFPLRISIHIKNNEHKGVIVRGKMQILYCSFFHDIPAEYGSCLCRYIQSLTSFPQGLLWRHYEITRTPTDLGES